MGQGVGPGDSRQGNWLGDWLVVQVRVIEG